MAVITTLHHNSHQVDVIRAEDSTATVHYIMLDGQVLKTYDSSDAALRDIGAICQDLDQEERP